jgi:hypothetical protein
LIPFDSCRNLDWLLLLVTPARKNVWPVRQ